MLCRLYQFIQLGVANYPFNTKVAFRDGFILKVQATRTAAIIRQKRSTCGYSLCIRGNIGSWSRACEIWKTWTACMLTLSIVWGFIFQLTRWSSSTELVIPQANCWLKTASGPWLLFSSKHEDKLVVTEWCQLGRGSLISIWNEATPVGAILYYGLNIFDIVRTCQIEHQFIVHLRE